VDNFGNIAMQTELKGPNGHSFQTHCWG